MFACGAFIANAARPGQFLLTPIAFAMDRHHGRYVGPAETVSARHAKAIAPLKQWQEIVLIQQDKKTNFGGRERTFATLSMTNSAPSRNRAW